MTLLMRNTLAPLLGWGFFDDALTYSAEDDSTDAPTYSPASGVGFFDDALTYSAEDDSTDAPTYSPASGVGFFRRCAYLLC